MPLLEYSHPPNNGRAHSNQWGFPKQSSRTSSSYWLEQAAGHPLLTHNASAILPKEADAVIIGSGIVGCLIAERFSTSWPEKKLIVLEAREFCSGATGRNAGHCNPMSWRKYAALEKLFSADAAIEILQREDDGLAALQDYVIQNNVDCDLLAGFTFDVPTTQDLADQAEEQFHMYNDAGGSTERIIAIHNPGLAAELTGVKNARSCYIRPAATLQPWKLAAHIMRKNLDRGVALHTFKMVKTVVPSSDPRLKWTVRTDRGDVSCNTVIHATNAYAAAIEPMFRGVVRPYPQICIKAASIFPVTETTGLLGHSYTILLAEEKYVSVNSRTSSDGVVLLGGNIEGQARLERWVEDNPEHCVDDDIIEDQGTAADLRHFSKAHLSANSEGSCLADVDSDDNWSGIICSTPDRVPIIGEIPGKEGQWACVGFNGRGMVHAFPATSALIKLMVGGLWVDTGLPEAYSLTSQRLTG